MVTITNALKSKTVLFNVGMAGIEVLHASVHMLEPIMSPDIFVYTSLAMGVIHGMGGVLLRTVTTVPLGEK